MARFTEDVTVVNRLSGRVFEWELCEPVSYRTVDTPDSETVNVPPEFATDFASVPRPFWAIISPWGRHGRAAIVHDFLYQLGGVTDVGAQTMRRPSKREADRIFREAMRVLDVAILGRRSRPRFRVWVAGWRRWTMWAAVAAFGFKAYRRQQTKGSAPPLEHAMLLQVEKMVAAGEAR
ncbi:MAG: DUF1353 domain-containing protein [Actinobacteria bacterium]|nr:DUF1353 domain-containing protein [Actinomycetota bacterium]